MPPINGRAGGTVERIGIVEIGDIEGDMPAWANPNTGEPIPEKHFVLPQKTVTPNVQYGKVPNQEYHAFRHVVDEGLDPAHVKSLIDLDFQTKFMQVIPGKPFNQIINVNGIQLQYTAFEIGPNTFNIGRIHAVTIK